MTAGVLPRKPCVGPMGPNPSIQQQLSTVGQQHSRAGSGQMGRSISKWLPMWLGKAMITLLPTLLPTLLLTPGGLSKRGWGDILTTTDSGSLCTAQPKVSAASP